MAFGQWGMFNRVAKKEHVCKECEGIITVGELYVHWKSSGVDEDDGKFYSGESRLHTECQNNIDKEIEMPHVEVIEA